MRAVTYGPFPQDKSPSIRQEFAKIAGSGFDTLRTFTLPEKTFLDSAAEAGYANAWAYSFMYNFTTIGVDTILCVIAALIPAVSKAAVRIRDGK